MFKLLELRTLNRRDHNFCVHFTPPRREEEAKEEEEEEGEGEEDIKKKN